MSIQPIPCCKDRENIDISQHTNGEYLLGLFQGTALFYTVITYCPYCGKKLKQ